MEENTIHTLFMDLAKFGDSLLFCSSAIASHCQRTVLTKTSRQEKVPAKTSSVYSNVMLKAKCVQGVRVVESPMVCQDLTCLI